MLVSAISATAADARVTSYATARTRPAGLTVESGSAHTLVEEQEAADRAGMPCCRRPALHVGLTRLNVLCRSRSYSRSKSRSKSPASRRKKSTSRSRSRRRKSSKSRSRSRSPRKHSASRSRSKSPTKPAADDKPQDQASDDKGQQDEVKQDE